jgi:hypothetical protein
MISYLTNRELQNAVFHFSPPSVFSESYVNEREKVWQQELIKAEASGKDIWNGIVYTIEEMLQPDEETLHISLGSCEYKDIIFRIVKGRPTIVKEYGISHLPKYITLDCIPVTKDGKFVFGIRGNSSLPDGGSIGLIGGTANKDEMEIRSFTDLKKFMINEIKEETGLDPAGDNVSLYSINQFNAKYEFLYKVNLDIDSSETETYHKEGEFIELLSLSSAEVHNYDGPTLDAFRFARLYIDRF